MKLKSAGELFKQTYQQWNEHKAPRLGAALSYYTVFSLAPLLLLVISLAAYFFHDAHARSKV
ncbi:MAG: YihY/virulence factor BrkB family protein, partial [Chloroflexi bacterium]|nr:YihY/virulence factor BrkB family protein [Chloroflexota bacterium]